MTVYKISIEDYEKIKGQEYAPSQFFNPIQDIDNNWVISIEELNGIAFEHLLYLSEQDCKEVDGEKVCEYKNVQPIEYKPKPSPEPFK